MATSKQSPGIEGASTGIGLSPFVEIELALERRQIEGGEEPISHELENLSVVLLDRAGHGVEIIVEELDELVARQRIGKLRKAPEITEPDHRLDRLGRAPLDLTSENPMAGIVAEVGLGDGAGDVIGQARLGGHGKVGQQIDDSLKLIGIETDRPIGRA